MDYEARREAMNDAIAERARELMPDESEYTMDEDIPENIKDGVFDIAVLERAAAILKEWGYVEYPLKSILEELKKK